MKRRSFLIAARRIIIYAITIAVLFVALRIGREYWPTISKKLQGISTENEVKISTDKQIYSRGDKVRITVKNKTKIVVFYAQNTTCGASSWILEDCLGNEIPYYQGCLWATYQHRFTRLGIGETLNLAWNGMVYNDDATAEKAGLGCYKIIFPHSHHPKKPLGEGWGGDKLEAVSGMFFVK